MMWDRKTECLVGLFVVASSLACGGSEASTPPPRSATASENAAFPEQTRVTADEVPEPASPCAGSDCFECGDAVCLPGFYCDETRGVCSWLPACGQQTGCDCVQQTLSDCRCEQRANGIYANCH